MSMSVYTLAKSVWEGAQRPRCRRALDAMAGSGGGVILSYHNVVAPQAPAWGDRSLHLALDDFRAQLDALQETHRVVSLREAAGPPSPGDRPRAAITFDDAYRGCLRLAVPELVARGLPATVFVPPGLLGGDGFWWDLLADPRRGLPAVVRRRALERDRGRPPAAGPPPHPDLGPATERELSAALASPGLELGSHSWSHPNLKALEDDELRAELARPRAWLGTHFPDRALTEHLSFPYGLWDERVAGAAWEEGYLYAYRVDGGAIQPFRGPAEPLVLPRVNVPAGVTLSGFRLRAAGLLA